MLRHVGGWNVFGRRRPARPQAEGPEAREAGSQGSVKGADAATSQQRMENSRSI